MNMEGTRLTLESPGIGFRASVAFDRWDADRAQYAWRIDSPQVPEISAEGTDLRLGALDQQSDAKALRSLLVFFGAWLEAIEYQQRTGRESDNVSMFPDSLRPFADVLDSDSLAVLTTDTLGEETEALAR